VLADGIEAGKQLVGAGEMTPQPEPAVEAEEEPATVGETAEEPAAAEEPAPAEVEA